MGTSKQSSQLEALIAAGLYPADTAERMEKSIDDRQERLLAVLHGAEVRSGIKKVIAEALKRQGIEFNQGDDTFSTNIFSDIAPELDLTVNWQIVVDLNLNQLKAGWLVSS